MRNINPKLISYISDQWSGYSSQDIDDVEIIWCDRKIYAPKILLKCVLD